MNDYPDSSEEKSEENKLDLDHPGYKPRDWGRFHEYTGYLGEKGDLKGWKCNVYKEQPLQGPKV
jgi:hypothetical protein